MKHNFKYNRKAFTLVELLIVIAIIGILFIVLVSKVDFATDKAKTTGVQTDFRSFQLAFETVSRENAGFNTLGWDTGDKADNSLIAGYTYENADKDGGDRIRNSYDKGDMNLNGICEDGETWTGQKLYTETWTGIYTLDNPADATDMSAYLALEKVINKNLDPALQISIDPENKTIYMANGYQDPWKTEYHGVYLSNAGVDGMDRGAIIMYSDGPNKVFGSEQTIANGIVTVTVKNGGINGQDDLSLVTCYTYTNGYGEVATMTEGFSNNQEFLTGNNSIIPSNSKLLTINTYNEGQISVYIDGEYVSNAPYNQYVSIGSTISLINNSSNFICYSDYVGNTFGHQGEYAFDVVNNTTINAWFENTDPSKVSIIYRNTNETKQILASKDFKLSEIDTLYTNHLISTTEKYGFEFNSWNKTVQQIITEAKAGTKTIIVEPNYDIKEVVCNIKVISGTITTNDTTEGTFLVNSEINISANQPATGKKFAYWTNKDGMIFMNTSSFTLGVFADEVFTAHFVDENEDVNLVPTTSISAFYDFEIDKVRTYAQRFVPSNYTLDRCGLVFAKDTVYLENDMTLENVDGVVLKMSFMEGLPASGTVTNTVTFEDCVCLRAYVTYFDSLGQKHTIYSDAIMINKFGTVTNLD